MVYLQQVSHCRGRPGGSQLIDVLIVLVPVPYWSQQTSSKQNTSNHRALARLTIRRRWWEEENSRSFCDIQSNQLPEAEHQWEVGSCGESQGWKLALVVYSIKNAYGGNAAGIIQSYSGENHKIYRRMTAQHGITECLNDHSSSLEVRVLTTPCSSPIWSSGEDPWFSPRWPGFNSRYGNLTFKTG